MIIDTGGIQRFESFAFPKVGKIMAAKYVHLMLSGASPDTVTLDIDFTDEAVVQYDIPVRKLIL